MDIVTSDIERASTLVGELARRDVSHFSHADLLDAHDAVARLGRLVGTLQARFAGEIARRSAPDLPGGGLARREGYGNAGQLLARVTGGTTAGAMRSIEAGRALLADVEPFVGAGSVGGGNGADGVGEMLDGAQSPGAASRPAPRYPAIAEASFAGDLSVDAAALIVAGLDGLRDRIPGEQLRELEQKLVEKATYRDARDVKRIVARAVARADVAGHMEREERQHAERYLAWTEDQTGMVMFSGKLDAVTAAPIRTVIEQIVTQQFRARRENDPASPDNRTVGQMRADALYEVCRHALGCTETDRSGVRTTIVVRLDQRDLEAGVGLGSIDGTDQPVSVRELRRLAGDGGVIPAVLGGDGEVLDLGRSKRMFTRAQRIALLERDGGCAKCHAPPEHCEAHHIEWWDRGGGSDLNNGVMLCTRCHHDVHRQGWEIEVRRGLVEFIPPPTIDPKRRAIMGGVAALEVGRAA